MLAGLYSRCTIIDVSSKSKDARFSRLGYRISSYFADGLSFAGPGRLIAYEVLEVLLDKPKDKTAITVKHLKTEDREWLTVGRSPVDWTIDVLKLKARFQIEDLPWLPEGRIDCTAEDLGDYLKIHITPASLDR